MAKFKSSTRDQGQLIPMYLSDWIPENHLVYLVNDIVNQLDLSAITSQYTNRGEEAYHPALMLKILFYGYATGIFTSRKLREAIDDNIPFRWLCGGLTPDFRTISDFRKNNLNILPKLFTQIIGIARKLGYVSLGHVSIDGSKIKANASKHKAMSRERMKQEINRLEKEIVQMLEKAQSDDEKEEDSVLFPEPIGEIIKDRKERIQKIKSALEQLEIRNPAEKSKIPEKDQINFTDADSRIMNTKAQGVIQAYNPQIAVDADNGMIVGLKMNHSSSDQKQFTGVLNSVQEINRKVPDKVTADAGYFSADNIEAAKSLKVDAYIAAVKEGKQARNPYDKSNFTYQPETDTYLCPAGKILKLKYVQHVNDDNKPTKWVYECLECPECSFQDECIKGKLKKRKLTRTEADPIRETMRTKVQSDAGKAIYKLRKSIVEPVWGQIKQCQGFRQFHLRGDEKVEGEFIMLALSYNLRKIHSAKHPKKSTLYKRKRSAQKWKNAA